MGIQTTSREALAALSLPGKKGQADDVLLVVTLACKSGHKDMSLREIKRAYMQRFECDIDVSTVSGRVNELVAAKRLLRLPGARRLCSLSGASVLPVTVPVVQARMFY